MTVTTQEPLKSQQEERRDELARRLFDTCLSALDIWGVYLGHHLGYYRALTERGPLTSAELASAAVTHERYAREWLEQQAATGILVAEDAAGNATDRRYSLEAGPAEALLDRDSLSYTVPLVRYYQATALLIPRVLEAHRAGTGISWTEMGDEIREAKEGFNRAIFLRLLTTEDLPAIPDVDARLRADPPARVADIGCGAGWSSIAIARAYPTVRVDGFDFDPAVIATARHNAAASEVADRIRFEVRRADDPDPETRYDLVAFFECVHDLARPVDALAAAHRLLAPGGTVIVMDEAVAERFTAPAGDVDRMMYGWSLVQCLRGEWQSPHRHRPARSCAPTLYAIMRSRQASPMSRFFPSRPIRFGAGTGSFPDTTERRNREQPGLGDRPGGDVGQLQPLGPVDAGISPVNSYPERHAMQADPARVIVAGGAPATVSITERSAGAEVERPAGCPVG